VHSWRRDGLEAYDRFAMSDAAIAISIEGAILFVRGHRVMLDATLADLYGVETRALIQAVRRNPDRFPADFMFQLSASEAANLTSQSVISSGGHGGRRRVPYVFTEHGVAMLSSVLRSPRAVQVNIEIVRAFVRLRQVLAGTTELAARLDELERQYDQRFRAIFDAIRELMKPPPTNKRQLGFRPPESPPRPS
jgi:ORF6N domain